MCPAQWKRASHTINLEPRSAFVVEAPRCRCDIGIREPSRHHCVRATGRRARHFGVRSGHYRERYAVEHVGLFAQHASQVAKPFEMLLTNRREDCHIRFDHRTQCSDFTGRVGAHLDDGNFCIGRNGEQREGHADQVVEVALGRMHHESAAQCRLEQFFVLVLPLEPATAITLRPHARRHAVASWPSATSVSCTTYTGRPRPTALVASLTTRAAAPRSRASARKSCASNRSPRNATNTSPFVIWRVSVDTPLNGNNALGPVPSARATRS
jgi:hypothetical protein